MNEHIKNGVIDIEYARSLSLANDTGSIKVYKTLENKATDIINTKIAKAAKKGFRSIRVVLEKELTTEEDCSLSVYASLARRLQIKFTANGYYACASSTVVEVSW